MEITKLAQDRKSWRGLTSEIEKAVEVAQTKNWDAKPQYVSQSVFWVYFLAFPGYFDYNDSNYRPKIKQYHL